MNNQTIATSLSQSARLQACGVDPKTADMYYGKAKVPPAEYYLYEIADGINPKEWFSARCNRDIIPAWSTARLLELLPECINGHWLTIQKINKNGHRYCYALGYLRCEYQDKDDPDDFTVYSDNKLFKCASKFLIESIIKAIEWLTKEGYKLNKIEE